VAALRPPPRVLVWTAATVALLCVAVLLWRGSDAAATDSTTAPEPEPLSGRPDAELTEVWSRAAGPLPFEVVEGGRVLVGGERGITALDPATGEEAWHYTRANARLCDLTAEDGVVIGVFATERRCDEAVALDAGTGVRAWTRNVGFWPEVRLSSTDQLALAVNPNRVVVLDPTGNGYRWTSRVPEGCEVVDAAVGSTGVGVLQRCGGTGVLRLRLLDGFEGGERWTREVAADPGADARLAGVDGIVSVVVEDRLQLHEPESGDVLQDHDLPAGGTADEPLHSAVVGSLSLVWARGTLWALDAASGEVRWEVPATGLPPAEEVSQVVEGAEDLLVPDEDGFVRRDVATGEETGRLPVEGGLAAGGRASVIGPVVVYRLPDRVVAYR
jgi:outer membrane protein assembly factor BamB